MAIFKYTVEGIYETDKGSGQKDFNNFNFVIELPRFNESGALTHIMRRFVPMLIKANKKMPLFSRIKHIYISKIEKVSEGFGIENKDIAKMNEEEIQKLACMYDLYQIPLPYSVTISELQNKAVEAYMERVLKIPMKTPEEKEALGFFVKQSDGTYRIDLQGEEVPVQVMEDYIGKKEVVKKKTLSDFIKQAGQTVATGILKATGNTPENDDMDEFPSADDLEQ